MTQWSEGVEEEGFEHFGEKVWKGACVGRGVVDGRGWCGLSVMWRINRGWRAGRFKLNGIWLGL